MHILMWFLMGDLTLIMDGVLHETPDWGKRFASFMTKALVARRAHEHMTSGSSMQKEIENVVQIYEGGNTGKKFEEKDIILMTHVVQGTHYRNGDLTDTDIDEKEFVIAMTEGVQLDCLWKMFDPDRRRPILQRLLDGNLSRRMQLAHRVEEYIKQGNIPVSLDDCAVP